MNTDTSLQKKRFFELALRCESKQLYTYSDFLTVAEQDLFLRTAREYRGVPYELNGGFPDAERKVARFGSADFLGYEEDIPISVICITPRSKTYADPLTHRDYLGSLMNLGIERSLLGDILIKEDSAYLFCLSHMAEHLATELTCIRHTYVNCRVMTLSEIDNTKINTNHFMTLRETVHSERADCILAKLLHLSRENCAALFRGKAVFIDGMQCENNAVHLKCGSLVSVRGYGKFRYDGVEQINKKGNSVIIVQKYV